MFTVALETTVSMGIMMAMGYIIRKKGWVNSEFTRQFSTMLYYSIIPCIIISSTINMEFDPQQLRKGAVMLGVGLLLIAVMAVFGQGLHCLVGKGEQGRLMRFSMVYTNFTMMGLALAQTLFGNEGLFYFSLMLIPVRVYSYVTADFMLCNDREAGQLKFSLKGVFSPLLVYTLVGLAIYIFQLPLPEVIRTTITTGSKAMTPCGMILCGLLLGQTNLGEKLHSPRLYAFLAAKLLGAPLAMMGVMAVFGFSGIVAQLPVLFCSLPVAAIMGTFSVKHDCDPESAAVFIAASTVCSVFTIPLMVSAASFL